jgi:hypothetical protein
LRVGVCVLCVCVSVRSVVPCECVCLCVVCVCVLCFLSLFCNRREGGRGCVCVSGVCLFLFRLLRFSVGLPWWRGSQAVACVSSGRVWFDIGNVCWCLLCPRAITVCVCVVRGSLR